MTKITHQIELFAKDMKAQRDLTDLVIAHAQAARDIPGFDAKYMSELEKSKPPNRAARVSKR